LGFTKKKEGNKKIFFLFSFFLVYFRTLVVRRKNDTNQYDTSLCSTVFHFCTLFHFLVFAFFFGCCYSYDNGLRLAARAALIVDTATKSTWDYPTSPETKYRKKGKKKEKLLIKIGYWSCFNY